MQTSDEPREQEIQATVESVVYRSADGRFSVLAADREPEAERLFAVGDLGDVVPGQTLRLRGRWETHSRYGKRFRVSGFTPAIPTSAEGIARYLGSGLVTGIGPALARRLTDRFGNKTLDVITGESHRLQDVEGIGPRRAQAIAAAVRDREREAKTLAFLHGLGLGPGHAHKIYRQYGEDSVRVLSDDPYLIAEQISGIGFRTADHVGNALGYASDDPRRAAGAALHLVGRAADEGHVFVDRDELIAQGRALEVPEERLLAALQELGNRHLLVVEGRDVYAPPLYEAEVDVATRLAQCAGTRRSAPDMEKALAASRETGLAEAQTLAVKASLQQGLLVLTGGPGTGKTTTVRAIVQAHRALERRVLLCAPTGRAARRLSDATGFAAKTIHRALEFNPAINRFNRSEQWPLDADLVLVDEASMLDVSLASKLLRATPPGAAVVLVGDADQLPPVAPGPVLRELLASGICRVVRLTQVFRQARESAIVRGAHDILSAKKPTPTPSGTRTKGDLFVVRATDPETMCSRLLETLERIRLAYDLDIRRDVQVLTPMRKGLVGAEQLNRLLQQRLNPLASPEHAGGLKSGDKVMQLRNDYEREVFNGDLGEIRRVEKGKVFVEMDGREIEYDRDAQDALSLAYASTVHKVQGSEFPAVVILLHSTHYVLLSRALLYTAVTRAKKLVVLLSDPRALGRAVANGAVHMTNSRLAQRLRSCAGP